MQRLTPFRVWAITTSTVFWTLLLAKVSLDVSYSWWLPFGYAILVIVLTVVIGTIAAKLKN